MKWLAPLFAAASAFAAMAQPLHWFYGAMTELRKAR